MKKKARVFEQLESLAHLVPTAFYWVDVDTTILGGNQIALDMIKMLSSTSENVIGKTAFDMFSPEIANELLNNNKKTIRAQAPLFFEETVIEVKTGKKRFRDVIRSPLYEDGKVVGILILLNDITENKEKTIYELEKQMQFRKLVDQTAYEFKSPLTILLLLVHQCSGRSKNEVFDILSRLTAITPTLLYWFDENNVLLVSNKWDSEAVGGNYIGKIPYDYFPLEIASAIVKNNEMVMKTGKILSFDELLRNSSTGEMNYFRAFKAPIFDSQGKSIGVLGTSVNVTIEKDAERLKFENELQKVKINEQNIFSKIVVQVVHDIRSPLASLSMILKNSEKDIPEQTRIALREATAIINDIANNLLGRYKKKDFEVAVEKERHPMIIGLALTYILSEKKHQYKDFPVKITHNFCSKCNFAFINADSISFKRMMSNFINNAVDALDEKAGKVNLKLDMDGDEYIRIVIEDNGKGMSREIKDKIMNNIAVTSGKKDGYGIGFTQIHEALEYNQGKLVIDSEIGKGTKITLTFPRITSPIWIAEQIELNQDDTVIILDDDISIHSAWKKCFEPYKSIIKLQHFRLGEEAIKFINNFKEKDKIFLLTDYELINQKLNGLQIIEQFAMQPRSILVTSHYDKQEIRDFVIKTGIKLLPKLLASEIPIKITEKHPEDYKINFKKVDLVIIDDNKLFTDSLASLLKGNFLEVDKYYNPKHFLESLFQYEKDTKICMDNDFGIDKIDGIELAKQLHEAGYMNLYLLTGKDFAEGEVPDYLTVVIKGDEDILGKLLK